ncbi:MAG TPA: DUF3109 family protein [Bacteroidia bacterium]|nr:DUF3109 family protein [Bacteroidia bacterium]
MGCAITAFPETLEWLGDAVSRMEIDAEALCRSLRRCDLSECRGTCCHDGVYLGPEEAAALRSLVERERPALEAEGLSLPEQVVVYGSWRGTVSGPKTAVRHEPRHGVVSGYPEHFPETACVFLLPDARCGLQALAMRGGLPPWFYKPLTCWLHPLAIDGIEEDRPVLTLHDESTDPQRFPDYDGFVCRTHCGRTCPGGEPAWQVLEEELRFLGGLAGRDLVAEIAEN